MKMPTICPKCNKPLNTVFGNNSRGECIVKYCKQYNHNITYYSLANNLDEVNLFSIIIDMTNCTRATFGVKDKKLRISINDNDILYLPFFEPDLSSYDKVIAKVKKYITFS